MLISLIAAMTKNRTVGKDNQMPWHLPADLQHFKQLTLGKPIIMGRKTYESIGRPLPNRRNIVLSRQKGLSIAGCEIFSDLESALAELHNEPEIMIIGGGNIFEQALPLAHKIYLTLIDATLEGDSFFPELDEHWSIIETEPHQPDEENPYRYTFLTLTRAF